MVEGSRVEMVMEDVANHCAWACLDNGLDLMIEYRELAHAPHLLIDRFEWRRLNSVGIASVLLGLAVPDYGVGGIAR